MGRRSRDGLPPSAPSEGDQDIWAKVTQTVRPLSAARRAHGAEAQPSFRPRSAGGNFMSPQHGPAPKTAPKPVPKPVPEGQRLAASNLLHRAVSNDPSATGPAGAAKLDYREVKKLHRGRQPIEATLDLHGHSRLMAHRRLSQFVERAYQNGYRWVLVITGKGVAGQGVIRSSVPEWLQQAPLNHYVVGLEMAHVSHGGAGAFYVRLRRAKA